MATLPQGSDLRKGLSANATTQARARAPDYGPAAAGARAITAGAEAQAKAGKEWGDALAFGRNNLGKSLLGLADQVGAQQDEVDDYETRKRLMDFKLATEMELEERKRSMPVGGEGYTQSWLDTYKDRAKDFVGEKDGNIPESQRAKVGLALKAHELTLAERAQRDENAERDRYTIDGLETTVSAHRSRVEADPNRLGEVQGEVGKLIELSPLTPAQRHVYSRKVRESLSEAAGQAIADRATSAQGLDEARSVLAPNAPDRRARVTQEGAMSVIETGTGAKLRVSSAYASRFAGLVADLEAEGVTINPDQSGGYANRNIRGTNTPSRHAHGEAIDLNWNENARGTQGAIRSQVSPDRIREIAAKHGLKWGGDWSNPDDMHFEVDRKITKTGAPVADAEAYAGPLADLPLAKRRAMWTRAQATYDKARTDVTKEITAYEANAAMGILPPAEILETIKRKVEGINDDGVTAQFNSTFRFAQEAAYLNKLPPQAIEQVVNQTAAKLGNEMTPEQGKRLEQVRKLEANVRSQVNADPLTYAHKVGLEVPVAPPQGNPAAGSFRAGQEEAIPAPVAMRKVQLEPLDFNAPDIDARLQRRAEQARNVGAYYSQPPQFFTKIERDALKDALNKGGSSMMFTLGKLYQGFGQDAVRAMGEIAETAPEAAIVGKIVAEGGNTDAATDVAKGLELRRQKGHISHVDHKARDLEIQTASSVLSKVPGVIDPVIRAADAAYDYRHKTLGKKEFDPALYRQTVSEIMGEKVDAQGRKWGGVGYQGSGAWDGKWKSPVIVPNGVAQDGFDKLTGALTQSDLAVAGTPLDSAGKPLRLVDVQRATWLSLSGGRYMLQTGTDPMGNPQLAVDRNGQPFVMDLNPALPGLRRRVPEVFADSQTGRTAYDTRLGVPSPVNEQTGLNTAETKLNRQFRDRAMGFKDDPRTRKNDVGAIVDALTPKPGGPSLEDIRVQSSKPQQLRD